MRNIKINSKFITLGDIFIAIPCEDVEAHINEALEKGAGLVFAEQSQNTKVVKIQDARLLASKLAKFVYPEQPKVCIAITGTNGKSSTAHFLSQIWTSSEIKSANLGTLGLFIDQEKISPPGIDIPNLTTPDSITLHKIMSYLKNIGVDHCVFEASSHALEQKRCHGIELTVAALTNFASDHLDYHKTRESYLNAKLRLFTEILPRNKPCIVSADFPDIYEKVSKINKNLLTFGLSEKNLVRATNIKETVNKIVFDLLHDGKTYPKIELQLFGKFQIMNILCAITLALASGIDIDAIVKALPSVRPLNGRMEHIRTYNGGDVFIDFAHTTEGFKNAITCFRTVCPGKLICVFGCGGNRDKSKRAEMGKIASEIADICIVTDDNPRTESPKEIRKQIISACPKAIEIESRKAAIHKALSIIQPGDFVIVAGKGHEDYQIYGDKKIHFNDKEEILNF